ncbi:MAG: hypothetical protein QOF02_3393 [Blastocatellia bacterium]|jgi:hypothetical protein|nr:hypothetical protein [Blastocatellia bacterium]
MSALSKAVLLFALNWLDAQLTIIWVRAQLATEGNGLMAWLMDMGDGTFLTAKLLIGAFAAYVLYRCSHLKLARRGMTLALSIYFGIMFVHAATGMSALGWHAPETVLAYLSSLPNSLLAVFS